jgi:hypothetical protein
MSVFLAPLSGSRGRPDFTLWCLTGQASPIAVRSCPVESLPAGMILNGKSELRTGC